MPLPLKCTPDDLRKQQDSAYSIKRQYHFRTASSDKYVTHNSFTNTKGGVSTMKIRPLNDRVLVIREEEEQKTVGGIIIPDTAKEKPQRGKIVAAGPGKMGEDGKRIPLEIKEGDRILFSKYAGTEIKLDGVEHLFMREDDMLSIVE
jgi:chaperonin GroES